MSCSLKILGKLWLEDYILSIKTLAFSWLITVSLFPLINKVFFGSLLNYFLQRIGEIMKDKDMNQMMTRRSLIIGGIQGGLGLTLIGRLYFLQVLNKEHYQFLSDKNRIQYLDLLPTRGKIFDRTGTFNSRESDNLSQLNQLRKQKEIQTLLKFLKSLIHMDDQTLDRINKQLKKRLSGHILLLKEGLSWQELSILELYSSRSSGLDY